MDADTYKNKAIEKLKQIQHEYQKKICSRSSQIQATAIGYAIAVLNKISTDEEDTD